MRVADFDFALPKELIAQRPATPRERARLLRVEPDALDDHHVADLPELLRPDDLLVFNDTRVLPARLSARRGEAKVELTLHQPIDERSWRAFAKPARKCRLGDRLDIAPGFDAEVIERGEHGEIGLRFSLEGADLIQALKRFGRMPLPPYIKRPDAKDPADITDYQTLFARHDGAVAAPTASLHFTEALMAELKARGVRHTFVTLHVGAGTFLPVRAEHTEDHVMHAERFELSAEAVEAIECASTAGGRVIAVGTTVLRTLEASACEDGRLRPGCDDTRLFITPGYRFRVVDRLLTNFHLPCSTLFMLVAAFSGLERMQSAYAHAVHERYRFFSYGDACLLTPAADLTQAADLTPAAERPGQGA
ncbi:MAG: tRNA preQ1(34) S-adenosylmethionine ribosyltransferase-isomerase QueA [Alphaproteobacteria bacterium]|nr:tRNA preQ1(34) S-adenosylmethionine ribosyltransferase-isomerase QueA [Alphaproteobacteria bacterium]